MAGAADKLVVVILLFVSSKAPVLVVLAAGFSSNVVPCAANGTPCGGSNAVSLRSVLDFCCGLCWRGDRPTSNALVRWGGTNKPESNGQQDPFPAEVHPQGHHLKQSFKNN